MASRSVEKGKAAVAEIQASGVKGSLSSIQLDITNQQSIEAAAKQVEDEFGRLDVLVNNAGIYNKDASLRTQLETTLNTNVIGAALVSEAFRPLLLKSKRPYLLHVGSGLGSLALAVDVNSPDYSVPATAYRMSEAALSMLAIQDSKVLGKHGVKVFVVCPGLVKSNLRGTADEEISAGGRAGDAEESGQMILSIIQGRRDADVGKFVHKDGVYPW
jgi:NAD(P)-dependent dehydrogenase (short-subunit alcohol dehydrogenase family)